MWTVKVFAVCLSVLLYPLIGLIDVQADLGFLCPYMIFFFGPYTFAFSSL